MFTGAPHEVKLEEYNYDTKEVEDKGTVSLRLLAKSLSTKALAVVLDDWLNSGSNAFGKGQEIGRLFHDTHRTLQGLFVNFALGLLSGYGEVDPRWTDPRNKVAVETAIKVKKLVDDGELHRQPFI